MRTIEAQPDQLRVQLLAWLSEAPRTYGDAISPWRSTWPRMSIWEDALEHGLFRIEGALGEMRLSRVILTDQGREFLSHFKF